MSAQSLTRDPISLILPFLTLHEFGISAIAISRSWYSSAQTMRSRHDQFVINNYEVEEKNELLSQQQQQQQQPQSKQHTSQQLLLLSSTLRHHVTNLIVQLYSSHKVDAIVTKARNASQGMWQVQAAAARLTIFQAAAASGEFPTHEKQLMRMNQITSSMPYLDSLSVNFLLPPIDTTAAAAAAAAAVAAEEEEVATASIKLPSRLRSLKFVTRQLISRINLPMEEDEYEATYFEEHKNDEEEEMPNEIDQARFNTFIKQLFTAVTNSESLCQSLRILESHVTCAVNYTTPMITSLHKLISLRRLALYSGGYGGYLITEEFVDALRAIPLLCEWEGTSEKLPYLLRAPCVQSYRRLSKSALTDSGAFSIYFGDESSPKWSDDTIHPSLLLSSSANSLIDLSTRILMSPAEFLPQFTRLKYATIRCSQVLPHAPTFTGDDLATGLSQCCTLERLKIVWEMSDNNLSESQIERIVTPLHRLYDLALCLSSSHEDGISSFSCLTRVPHLVSGLRYFDFIGQLPSIEEYRVIYSLTHLQLLCLNDLSVSRELLDTMFRPRTQERASYYNYGRDREPQLKGPGELPSEYLPHLKYFSQIGKPKVEWQKVIDEVNKEGEAELLSLP